MEECVDGEYQNFKARGGAYVRKEFFGKYPELLKLVEDKTDDQLARLRARRPRSGQRSTTLSSAPWSIKGQPTVILAKTVKGYGLGEAGEGKNITHQQKKLNEEELFYLSKRFDLNLPQEAVHDIRFVKPAEDSPEMKYLRAAPRGAGRLSACARSRKRSRSRRPPLEIFHESLQGSRGREASTTSGLRCRF